MGLDIVNRNKIQLHQVFLTEALPDRIIGWFPTGNHVFPRHFVRAKEHKVQTRGVVEGQWNSSPQDIPMVSVFSIKAYLGI